MFTLFWVSAALLVYVYVGYPLLCRLLAAVGDKKIIPVSRPPQKISILIAAYNEAGHIVARIHNIAACDRPAEIEVLIGSDGSTDETVNLARAQAELFDADDFSIRVFDLDRGGKLSVLKHLAREASGEVLVFSDANSAFHKYALKNIVFPLRDSSVGVAAGAKTIRGGHLETAEGEQTYWNFENRLKNWESEFGSCPGADGALYAIRRSDFPEVPTNRLLMDDFYISLSVIGAGKRCVFVADAIVFEPSDTKVTNEVRRKARIFAGAVNALLLQKRLLVPFSGASLALWSHKVLRWLGFLPLTGLLIGAAALPPGLAGAFYTATAVLLTAAGIGYLRPGALALGFVRIPYYFAVLNLGQMLGVLTWLKSRRMPTWEKVR